MADGNVFDRAQQDKFQKAVLVILLPSATRQEITDHQYTGFVYKCCDLLVAGAGKRVQRIFTTNLEPTFRILGTEAFSV